MLCYKFHFELILRVTSKKPLSNVVFDVLTGALPKIQVLCNLMMRWWAKFPASQGQIPEDLVPHNKYYLEDRIVEYFRHKCCCSYAPCEGVWGRGGGPPAPYILDLGTTLL